jgi:hypothetical protein
MQTVEGFVVSGIHGNDKLIRLQTMSQPNHQLGAPDSTGQGQNPKVAHPGRPDGREFGRSGKEEALKERNRLGSYR